MNRPFLMAIAAVCASALVATAACDSDDGGDGGGGSTATGTTQTGSGGGACTCYPCADYLIACAIECPPGDARDVVCPSSLPVLNAVNECICDPARGDCADECPRTCAMGIGGGGVGGGGVAGADTSDCVPCQGSVVTDVCKTEFDACAALRNCS